MLGAGFADRLRVPGLLLFLAIGMLIADEGAAIVTLDEPSVAQAGGSVALILILFHGGLTTRPGDIRRAGIPAGLLATAGVAVTAAVVAAGAALLLAVDATTSLLIGAVVASTDAAAVFAVLRRSPLPRRLTSLLEVESGVNDPFAVMLTVGVLATWSAQGEAWALIGLGFAQLFGGIVAGGAVGAAGAWLLNRADLGAEGLYPVLALATAGTAYGTAAVLGGSGFLAVFVCGVVVGAAVPRHRRSIRVFADGLANTAEIALFLLLGILVFPSELLDVALPGLAVSFVLIFVARPLAAALCLPWFGYSARDIAMGSWAGLRGAVPIVLATFPFTAGYPDGRLIFNLVFFVVLVSAAVQGITVPALARRLGLVEQRNVVVPIAEALPLDGVEADLVEVDITADLHVAGQRIRDVPLPAGGLLTAIVRGRRAMLPSAHTRLQQGDRVLVAMPRQRRSTEQVVAWARGEAGDDSEPM